MTAALIVRSPPGGHGALAAEVHLHIHRLVVDADVAGATSLAAVPLIAAIEAALQARLDAAGGSAGIPDAPVAPPAHPLAAPLAAAVHARLGVALGEVRPPAASVSAGQSGGGRS